MIAQKGIASEYSNRQEVWLLVPKSIGFYLFSNFYISSPSSSPEFSTSSFYTGLFQLKQ